MKIPLTIKHKKEDLPFFTMSVANLLSLLNIEYENSLNEECKITEDWINNERCKCCKNPLVKNKKISLNCEHLNKKINKNEIIKESEDKIERMSSALNIRNLINGYSQSNKVVGNKGEGE